MSSAVSKYISQKGVLWCVSRWGSSGSRCVSRVLVSVLSGHDKGVGMSQYLPQGNDVGMSEGVSILLG